MTVDDLDPGKVAAAATTGWADLEPAQRAVVKAAVAEAGGYFLELELLDDGTCTVSMAGVVVARVPAWTLLPAPEMPPGAA